MVSSGVLALGSPYACTLVVEARALRSSRVMRFLVMLLTTHRLATEFRQQAKNAGTTDDLVRKRRSFPNFTINIVMILSIIAVVLIN